MNESFKSNFSCKAKLSLSAIKLKNEVGKKQNLQTNTSGVRQTYSRNPPDYVDGSNKNPGRTLRSSCSKPPKENLVGNIGMIRFL